MADPITPAAVVTPPAAPAAIPAATSAVPAASVPGSGNSPSIGDRFQANLAAEQAGAPPASGAADTASTPAPASLGENEGQDTTAGGAAAPTVDTLASTRRLAQKFGLQDVENATEEELEDRLARAYEAQRVAAENERLRVLRLEQERLAQQAPQVTATPAPETGSKWWNPPKVDEAQLALYQEEKVDPVTGRVTVDLRADAPLTLKQQVKAREQYHQDFARKLVTDPKEALGPMLEEMVAERVRQQTEQYQSQTQEVQAIETFAKQNEAWLFERDPVSNQPVVQGNGYKLSPEGEKFNAYMQEAAQFGITARVKQLEYAAMKRENEQLRQRVANPPPAAPVKSAEQIRQEKQAELNARTTASVPPSRSPAAPVAGQVANSNLTIAQRLAANLQSAGQL